MDNKTNFPKLTKKLGQCESCDGADITYEQYRYADCGTLPCFDCRGGDNPYFLIVAIRNNCFSKKGLSSSFLFGYAPHRKK